MRDCRCPRHRGLADRASRRLASDLPRACPTDHARRDARGRAFDGARVPRGSSACQRFARGSAGSLRASLLSRWRLMSPPCSETHASTASARRGTVGVNSSEHQSNSSGSMTSSADPPSGLVNGTPSSRHCAKSTERRASVSSRTTPERSAREGARSLEVYLLDYGSQTSTASTAIPSFLAHRAKGSSRVASATPSFRARER